MKSKNRYRTATLRA